MYPPIASTSTFSAALRRKVSPIGYWERARYPISKCYHVEIIASTGNRSSGQVNTGPDGEKITLAE